MDAPTAKASPCTPRLPTRALAPLSIPGFRLRRARFAHTRSLHHGGKGLRMQDRAETGRGAPQFLLEHLRPEAGAAPESGIVEVMKYGRGREGLIPLWAGEGDLAPPPFIVEAATRSLAAGETFYTYQRGIPELREALARYHTKVFGRDFAAEQFFVTGSGMQSIQIALAMTVGAGQEIVVPTPTWPNAAAAAGVLGARPVEVPMRFGNAGWTLDLARGAGAIGRPAPAR